MNASANDYNKVGSLYSQHGIVGTGFLAYKALPGLIDKYKISGKILDFGCGAGRLTRFLKALGMEVDGADISVEMLNHAKQQDKTGNYHLIENTRIPLPSEKYEAILSTLVLFELPSLEKMVESLTEVRRVLKPGGIFIAVTGSTDMYSKNWLSLGNDYPENKTLRSGDLAKIKLTDVGLELYDYFWTLNDYKHAITQSKFALIDTFMPLGDALDGFEWKDEYNYSPYLILVMQRSFN